MSIALDQAINYRSKYEINVSNKTLAPKNRSGYSKKHSISRKIVNVFMIFSIILMGFFGVTGNGSKAEAGLVPSMDDICNGISQNGAWFNSPEKTYMSPSKTPDSGKITAYEKYGIAGMNWTVWRGPLDDNAASDAFKAGYDKENPYYANGGCVPFLEIVNAGGANMIFSLAKVTVFFSGFVYQIAFESIGNIIEPMQEQIAKVINPNDGSSGLKDTLYLDFIIPMIMISALYLGWVGLVKRKSSEALSAAVWMIGSAITGLVLLINPMIIPNASNAVVKDVTEGIMGGITGASSNGLESIGGTNLCSIDAGEDQSRNIVRLVQCSLWYSFLYVPWATGQYGVSPSDPDGAELLGQNGKFLGGVSLDAQGSGNDATPKNWPIYQIDQQVYSLNDLTSKDEAWANIPKAMIGEPAGTGNGSIENTVWKGDTSGSLIVKALLSLIAAIGSGMMIFVLGMSMIIMEIGLILMMMLAPLFFLIGVHPGFGRRVALKWVETIISLTLKRVVLSILLGVMITFYSIVIQIPEDQLPWFGTIIMVIAISIAGMKYKGTLTDMFSEIDLGGGGGLNTGDGGEKTKGALKGAAVGAAIAGGGMLLGARARKAGSVVKETGGNSTSRPKSLAEFHSKPAGDEKDEKPSGGGTTGGGGSGGDKRGKPEFDTDPETENAPDNTDEEKSSGGGDGGNTGGGGGGRPDEPNFDTDSDNTDEEKSSGGGGGIPERPEGAEALNGTKVKTKEEKAIERAHAKRAGIDKRLNKSVSKTSRPARVAGGMKTMARAATTGALLGYRGADPGYIAQSATQSMDRSRMDQKTKANSQVAAARRRQSEYNKAWKEFNDAQDETAKKDAKHKLETIHKGMSSKERSYIKSVGKINNKVTTATGGALPTRAKGQLNTKKHADPGALPPKPINK